MKLENGTRDGLWVCEDVPRCEICLAPFSDCQHALMTDEEIREVMREVEAARVSGRRMPLRCRCNNLCRTIYP